MKNGFIKLHRKITEWEWYNDANAFRLFIHLLIKANHEPKRWRGISIDRGQTVTGIIQLSKDLKISYQSIRTSLNRLKSTNEITIQTTNKYSLITIVKWTDYQFDTKKLTNKLTSQPTNNQQTTNKQLTTNKNDKELKECKEKKNGVVFSKNSNQIKNQLKNLKQSVKVLKDAK